MIQLSKKINKNIMFRPQRKTYDSNFKKFSVIFSVCVLTVLLVSCLSILIKHDFNVRSAMGGDSLTTTNPEAESTTVLQTRNEKTFFLWCSDSDGKKLRFAWIMNIKVPEMAVSVYSVPLNMQITQNGETLNAAFIKYGKNETANMLKDTLGIPIDGYIGADDESFKAMINYFGGIDITVPEQIEYRSEEFTVILVGGEQNLKGDTLLKYLRYLETLGARGDNLQSTALLDIADKVFRPENLDKRARYFSKISNTLETDLSIIEYSAFEESLKALMQNGIEDKIIAESPQDF